MKNRSINYLQQEYIAKEISINSLQDYTEIESFYFIEEEHPLEKMLETELEKTIKSAIHTLPEECRTAFILSRYHDMKYEEIASQECPIQTENRIKRLPCRTFTISVIE